MNVIEAKTSQSNPLLARSNYAFRVLAQQKSITENGDKLVNVMSSKKISIDPFWMTPGDEEGEAYSEYRRAHPEFCLQVRRPLAKKLEQASLVLPNNWTLVIKAGYRPFAVQMRLLEELTVQAKQNNPLLTDRQALDYARVFVTDPAILCPPHCAGAAVDVDVLDSYSGMAIDMGCPPNTADERAFTHYDRLTSVQVSNRQILLKAMLQAGFANLAYEWWHFSYGDQYWAAFYNQPAALYNIVKENHQL